METVYRNDFRLTVEDRIVASERSSTMLTTSDLTDLQFTSRGTVTLSQVRIPSITLIRVAAPSLSLVWRRSRERARRRRVFLLVRKGQLQINCGGQSGFATPTMAAIVESGNEPVKLILSGPEAELIALTIDNSQLQESLHPRGRGVAFVAAEKPVLKPAIYNMLDTLIDSIPPDTAHGSAGVISSFLIATGNAISAMEAVDTPVPSSFIDTARSFIELWHKDPDFTVERLAAQLGISTRTLQKRFAENGTNAGSELRKQRVNTAIVQLSSRPTLSVADVASASGFSNPQVMRESLRVLTGKTPRIIRAAALSDKNFELSAARIDAQHPEFYI